MSRHYYSTVAVETTLTSGISNSATTMAVGSTTGFPGSFPYYLGVDFGAAGQEVVEVTNAVGLSLTVVRGVSGTSGVAHDAGATVVHVAPSDFYNETHAHAFATADVHGVSGTLNTVIGDLDTRIDALEDSVLTEAQGYILVPASATAGTAINAALTALPAGGGTIVLGGGTHTINTAVLVNKTVIIKGMGQSVTALSFDGGVVTTAIKMADTTQRQVVLSDFRINTTTGSDNTGTAIDGSYFFNSAIARVNIGSSSTQTPNIGIDFNALGTYYNTVDCCRIQVGGAGAVGVRGANNANDNTVSNTKILGDTSATSVQLNTAHSWTLDKVSSDTAAMAIGIDLQTGAHDTTMIGCYLEGLNIGLKLASGVESPRYIGGYIASSVTANIQDNGAVGMTVDNSWVEFNPYSSLVRTGVVANTINGTPVPANTYQASDYSVIAWNYDPVGIQGTTTLTNGTLHLVRVKLRFATTITNLLVSVGTAGITPTAGQSFLGLYNAAGTLVATTADAGTALTGTSLISVPLTAPYVAVAGEYWVAVMVNFATAPLLARASNQNIFGTFSLGATAANRRFAINGTALTALPGSITPASNATATTGQTYWVGCN
jgi:hypothetical protein